MGKHLGELKNRFKKTFQHLPCLIDEILIINPNTDG
jgi:hypothetical protein